MTTTDRRPRGSERIAAPRSEPLEPVPPGPALDHGDVARSMASADVFVFPSCTGRSCHPTVMAVLADVARRPWHHLVARWNWKAALMSSVVRGLVFFAATRGAGVDAAAAALAVEFAFRVSITGCFASLTQAFRRAAPGWAANLVVIVAIPAMAHALQFGVHRFAGTAELGRGMVASIVFTTVSAAFTLFAMRRDVLIVGGAGRQSFRRDVAALPGLVAGFVVASGRVAWRCLPRPGGIHTLGRLA